MKVTSSTRRGFVKRVPSPKGIKKAVLSTVAVLFTLAPIFSIGLWIHNVYFSDPRETIALKRLEAPAEPPKLFREPIVTVTFDDGWESIYSKAAPILQKHGIRTTQYILSGQFDHYNYLSREQVLSLQSAGHDIQSHTITHADLAQLDSEMLTRELKESKQVISQMTNTRVSDFASPLNSYSPKTMKEIKRHYRSHRNTEASPQHPTNQDYNLKPNFNRWQINAFSVRRTTTVEDIERFLAGAKQRNGWAVLVYHEVDSESPSYYAVTPKHFAAQMKAVAASGLRIATMDEVMDYYYRHHLALQGARPRS